MPAIQSCCRRPVLGVKTSYSLDPPRPGQEQFRMPACTDPTRGQGAPGKKCGIRHGPEGRLRRSHTPGVLWGAPENFPRALAHPRQRAAFTPTGLTPQKRALTSPQALCFNPARSRSTFARRQPPEACGSAGGGSRAAPCALFRALSRPPPRPPAASRWRPTAQTCVKPSLRSLQRVSCRYRQPRGADIDPSSRLSTSTGVRRAAARAGGGERDEGGPVSGRARCARVSGAARWQGVA